MSELARSEQRDGSDAAALGARVGELEALLRERAEQVARAKRDLAAFSIDYRQRVGRLHEELDDLEAAIAEAELGQIARKLEDEPGHTGASPMPAAGDAMPRYTSDAVRRLFREVAKAIHPDLAEDSLARDHRHAMMIEANQAYALGDEERLRWILQSWSARPEAVAENDPDAARLRLQRRIMQLEEQLTLVAADLDAVQQAPMWKLKAMVDEAAAGGKDLVRDMIARLKVDIMIARNRLHAIEWTPDA